MTKKPTAAVTAAHRPLQVDYMLTSILVPNSRNARTHPKKQRAQLLASISKFGFTNPILVDEKNEIIAGHARHWVAKELGLEEVPVIVLRGLNEAEKKALRLADNKIQLGGGWDLEILRLELSELASSEISVDLGLTGFSTGEIDVILSDSTDPDDEVIPALPKTPSVLFNDIFDLRGHRVGCGDGRDLEFVSSVVGQDERVDCAFLDAPFNVKINGHANAKGRHREFAEASGEMSTDEFRDFLKSTLGNCVSVSRSGAVHFICMDWRHIDDVSATCNHLYRKQLNLCIWNKSNAGMGSLYRSKHELVFVYRVGDTPHFNAVELGKHGRNRTNVWDYQSVNSMRGSRHEDLLLHPTVKPTAMVADAICDVTRQGEVVLDIFLGSGTTLLACERTNRRFRGLDIDPAYVEVALKRWSEITGEEPKLIYRSGKECAQ